MIFTTALSSPPAHAFDPNADAEDTAPRAASGSLPSTGPLLDSGPHRSTILFPQVTNNASSLPPIQFDPVHTPPLVPPVVAVAPPAPNAQPVPTPTGFIAPAPLIAQTPPPSPALVAAPAVAAAIAVPAAVPVAVAAPIAIAPAPAADTLTPKSKSILKTLPPGIGSHPAEKAEHITVSRVNPKVDTVEGKPGAVESYESSGITIAVRRPGVDTNAELNTAYTDLSNGDAAGAIEAYKRVLAADPLNQDALFSLASVYHRQGELDKARTLYGILLKNYPTNRDGLNNFLVLVSDEAPQSALAELQQLEQRNPDFSPIPAQEALLLNKMGYIVEARKEMLKAIALAPDNLTYKYNLAVMFDSQGDYADAAALYRELIQAANDGGSLPTSADALQKRMNFIAMQTTQVVKTN